MNVSVGRVHALIWTTTPWSLPGNQAVCFNSALQYSLIQLQNDSNFYLIATDLVDSVKKTLNADLIIVKTISGISFL